MLHTILIGIDAVGEFPCHLRDDEELPTGNVRWRFVAQTDDGAEAVRIMGLVSRRCSRFKGRESSMLR